MPFNWKKKNRFSRLVADHLQSPKRGGSLVVETGFPTSLIDLYVRNRSRFRKPNKQSERNESDSSCELSDVKEVVDEKIMEEDVVFSDFDDVIDANDVEKEECGGNGVGKGAEMAKLSPVYVGLLKVLLIVVLVLGSKRFKVGITLSAFVLFVLEMVGKPILRRSSLSRSSSLNEIENSGSLKGDKNVTRVVSSEVLEIEEQVESKKVVTVRSEETSDEVTSESLVEIRRKSSRRDIMKSRMKKLVPKKLWKTSVSSKDEIISGKIKEEEERVKCVEDVKLSVLSSECSKGETLSIVKQEQDMIVELEGPSSLSSTLSSEIDCNDKELGREEEQEWNSGYLVLCLIVLVGLIGGRLLALVLALSWCLMQKMSQW